MIRESLADSNQIQWQVLAKSLADSRLWQILYIYSTSIFLGVRGDEKKCCLMKHFSQYEVTLTGFQVNCNSI